MTQANRASRFSFLDLARHMGATHRQRASLKTLDRAALCDIGLSARQAQNEAKRPIWDVLDTWRG
jgi:uncharacterized protein YjiS (DUF1127 family)